MLMVHASTNVIVASAKHVMGAVNAFQHVMRTSVNHVMGAVNAFQHVVLVKYVMVPVSALLLALVAAGSMAHAERVVVLLLKGLPQELARLQGVTSHFNVCLTLPVTLITS
jgi:hypothetical protein